MAGQGHGGDVQVYCVRQAAVPDAGAMAAIYAPHVLRGTASLEYEPPGAEAMAARLAAGCARFPWLVCEGPQGVVGYCYAGRFGARPGYDWTAESSVYIDEAARHHGAGSLLYTALFGLLRAQGYRTLYGVVTHPNPASEAFHTRHGFVLQGRLENAGHKFGRPIDVYYYAKRLLPLVQNPPPPVPFEALDAALVRRILGQAAAQARGERPK